MQILPEKPLFYFSFLFPLFLDYCKIKAKSGGDKLNVHSVNYKDYLNLVLKGAGLCLFEVDVEK